MTHYLVLGGNRFAGLSLTRHLVEQGGRVTLFNRGNRSLPAALAAQVQIINGDRNRSTDLAAVDSPDIVFDMCCYEPAQAAAAVDLFGGVQRYVYVSSVAAYQQPITYPLSETDSLGEWPYWGPYGPNKAATDAYFREAHRTRGFPVTIFRPTYVLGPGNHVEREAFYVSRLQAGLPVVLPGEGEALLHFIFADEVARALIALSTTPAALGQAYNGATDQAVTLRQFVQWIAVRLGVDAQIISAAGVSHAPYDAQQLSPFGNTPVLIANEKLKADCAFSFEPLLAKLGPVIDTYASQKSTPKLRPQEAVILAEAGYTINEGS